jgi:hypothetical protein
MISAVHCCLKEQLANLLATQPRASYILCPWQANLASPFILIVNPSHFFKKKNISCVIK